MAAVRPITRDFKRTRRGDGFDPGRWKEFALGLGIGLAVAGVVFLYQRSVMQAALAEAAVPKPGARETRESRAEAAVAASSTAVAASAEDVARQFDFYDMLPNFEVVVPEREREVRRDIPNAPIERPGVYVLQAGSYRNVEDAQRIARQLSLQGIDAVVQRVQVDADVWHRVRIGPVNDLPTVNRLRDRLRDAELDALVIRVGD